MKLSVVGAGYVGLVTAAVFADFGNKVTCIDIDEGKIKQLTGGEVPFFEPSLSEYIERNLESGNLNFTTSNKLGIGGAEIVFICVGTPPKVNGEADLSFLFSALGETAKHLDGDAVIAIKSTFPVGFEDDLDKAIKDNTSHKYEFAVSPEFLREGTAIQDTLKPDRIVIGTFSKRARDLLIELHRPISGERVICDPRSAQLIKYASNAFLATKISYANAISIICEKMDADSGMVLKGVGLDRRIGLSYLSPGVGYGGSCLPKDVLAFIAQAKQFDYDFDLLSEVDNVNNDQITNFVEKIKKALGVSGTGKVLVGKSLAVLGLSFKPNTDDMREAPSVKIINRLVDLGASVTAYDPIAMDKAKLLLPKINYAKNPIDATIKKDALAIVTEWPQFLEMDLARVKREMKKPVIIDGRNIFDPKKVRELGFIYYSVSR